MQNRTTIELAITRFGIDPMSEDDLAELTGLIDEYFDTDRVIIEVIEFDDEVVA